MNSFSDIRRLLNMSEHRQRRCEQDLQHATRRLKPVTAELSAIAVQEQSLQQVLASHRADTQVLAHHELMALLRRQAVVRRQLQNLTLERARVDENRELLERQLQQHSVLQRGLVRKHKKLVDLSQRVASSHRLIQMRREENEIEELPRILR